MRPRTTLVPALALAIAGVLGAAPGPAAAQAPSFRSAAAVSSPESQLGDGSKLADPDAVLPANWRRATDRAVSTAGDADGLHLLAADEPSGYQWRTAATLAEPGYDTDQWIGQACVTGSGQRAVVVYAPRQFTNHADAPEARGFVAVVDLRTDVVLKTALRVSLAYFNPGCGSTEDVAFASSDETASSSTVTVLDAASGRVRRQFDLPGQITSAVPYAGGVAAVSGSSLVATTSTGDLTTLRQEAATPFRVHPDADGGLAYQVPVGHSVEVRRWKSGQSTLLGTGDLGAVQVAGSAGRVFVIGPQSTKIRSGGSGWTLLDAPANAEPSTTGALVVTGSTTFGSSPAAGASAPQVGISALATATRRAVDFTVSPDATRPDQGLAASPGLTSGQAAGPASARSPAVAATVDPSTVPWDPDRGCAVPRNDPTVQTLQATAAQVEWAADLAVQDSLMITRPANWMGSGMPAPWQPQIMFGLHPLANGGTVPAQVLLGVLAQESNTMQASPHNVDGVTGNFNQGGFYGNGSSWSTVDCGYGVGQVTTGMSVADGMTSYTPNQQRAIATDYASNIAASLNALIDKWNQLQTAGITANSGDSQYIENWYLAAWAYNTGVQPSAANGNTRGCTPSPTCDDGNGHWGLGWSNNPANPSYPADRALFNAGIPFDTKHPNLWPYQEKVIGWAKTPVARYDYVHNTWAPAYAAGYWFSDGAPQVPDYSTFCSVTVNSCSPKATTDVNGHAGAGLCQLSNSHCWWHQPNTTWVACPAPAGHALLCGTQVLNYLSGTAEPSNGVVYPPDCSTAGLPANAVIVDDVTTPSAVPCAQNWTDSGAFTLHFADFTQSGCTTRCITYQGKIDFHQSSTGFGGHLWFTHAGPLNTVTGTWTPPAATTGWTRIKVHIPQSGATTQQADYQINLGNGQTRHRVVNQHWSQNTWVDLGTFNLAAGASVSLSNASVNVASTKADGGDLAFDALAFIPSSQPVASYVALGDSYSSGESAQPYDSNSDQSSVDECHRSATQAYSMLLHLPGQSATIAALAAGNQAVYHSLACSGSQSVDMTQASVQAGDQENTDWRVAENYHEHEVNQIDDSGWLDQDTTLVTVSVGGNDVGFPDVLIGCTSPTSPVSCIADSFRLSRSHGDVNPTTRVDTEALTAYEPYLIGKLEAHLAAVYQQIHLHAPNAEVLVVGYPHLFHVVPGLFCGLLTSDVQTWMNQMSDALQQTITGAVLDTLAKYPSMNIKFVDAIDGFTGHGVCEATSTPWINGPNLVHQSSSFHPNHDGYAEYAALVNAAL